MEDDAVVEVLGGELAEVLDGLGRVVVEELERDRPVAGVHIGCAHRLSVRIGARDRSVAHRHGPRATPTQLLPTVCSASSALWTETVPELAGVCTQRDRRHAAWRPDLDRGLERDRHLLMLRTRGDLDLDGTRLPAVGVARRQRAAHLDGVAGRARDRRVRVGEDHVRPAGQRLARDLSGRRPHAVEVAARAELPRTARPRCRSRRRSGAPTPIALAPPQVPRTRACTDVGLIRRIPTARNAIFRDPTAPAPIFRFVTAPALQLHCPDRIGGHVECCPAGAPQREEQRDHGYRQRRRTTRPTERSKHPRTSSGCLMTSSGPARVGAAGLGTRSR